MYEGCAYCEESGACRMCDEECERRLEQAVEDSRTDYYRAWFEYISKSNEEW